MLSIRFDPAQLHHWARRYAITEAEERIEREIAPRIRQMGYLTQPDFLALTHWKSPRSQRHCQKNSPTFIQAVTKVALTNSNVRLCIEVLTLLRGVDWPTASVILHFGSHDPYPILDFRALWSLGIEEPIVYDFEFWWRYVVYCRGLAQEHQMSMRTLDRALWQYSKENQ